VLIKRTQGQRSEVTSRGSVAEGLSGQAGGLDRRTFLRRSGLAGGGLAALARFVWMAVLTVCVVPVVAVASLGEIARVRALPWYAGATGVVAASAPWLIRAILHLPRAAGYNFAELRFAIVFFVAGLISGSVYWLLAGRDAGAPLREL